MDMIGKTLYKAKIKDRKIVMQTRVILRDSTRMWKFSKKGAKQTRSCMKSDVGVVCFLTQKEALDYLIKELEHSVERGETYLVLTKQQLEMAKGFLDN